MNEFVFAILNVEISGFKILSCQQINYGREFSDTIVEEGGTMPCIVAVAMYWCIIREGNSRLCSPSVECSILRQFHGCDEYGQYLVGNCSCPCSLHVAGNPG
jgi:hypothetical protein